MNKSSVVNALVVEFADTVTYLHPSDFSHFLQALIAQVGVKTFVGAEGVYGISHGIDVPIIDLNNLVENLATARLFGDDRWSATLHRLKWSNTKRL